MDPDLAGGGQSENFLSEEIAAAATVVPSSVFEEAADAGASGLFQTTHSTQAGAAELSTEMLAINEGEPMDLGVLDSVLQQSDPPETAFVSEASKPATMSMSPSNVSTALFDSVDSGMRDHPTQHQQLMESDKISFGEDDPLLPILPTNVPAPASVTKEESQGEVWHESKGDPAISGQAEVQPLLPNANEKLHGPPEEEAEEGQEEHVNSASSSPVRPSSGNLPPVDESPSPTTTPKKKAGGRKKRDRNLPAAVSSAYAFFFKETQASVKTHNPKAKFSDVSKIVASMWASLGEDSKAVYRKRNEEDKKRYEREMEEYQKKQDDQQKVAATMEEVKPSTRKIQVTRGQHGTVKVNRTATAPSQVPEPISKTDEVVNPEDVTDHECIRKGCAHKAVRNIEWEDEYCSNECVVAHCKDVFKEWVQALNA